MIHRQTTSISDKRESENYGRGSRPSLLRVDDKHRVPAMAKLLLERGAAPRPPLRLPSALRRHFASGSGRSWKCTAMGFMPLPPSISHGARSPLDVHSPRPFQPALGSSMRPSNPLA